MIVNWKSTEYEILVIIIENKPPHETFIRLLNIPMKCVYGLRNIFPRSHILLTSVKCTTLFIGFAVYVVFHEKNLYFLMQDLIVTLRLWVGDPRSHSVRLSVSPQNKILNGQSFMFELSWSCFQNGSLKNALKFNQTAEDCCNSFWTSYFPENF